MQKFYRRTRNSLTRPGQKDDQPGLLSVYGRALLLLALAGALVSLTACATAATPAEALEPVTLQLNWVHSPEFAGYYAADALGYYAEEGLDVTFIERTPGSDIAPSDVLANGDVDFAVQGVNDIIRLTEDGHDPLALAAFFQISPRVFFSLQETAIKSPKDMVGKRIAIKSNGWRNSIHAVLERVGIDSSEIIEVEADFDAMDEMLFSGEVDMWTGFVNDEVVHTRQEGYEVDLIFPSDYAVGTYIGLIATMESVYRNNPELAERFVRASARGWAHAIENPREAAETATVWDSEHTIEFHEDAIHALTPLIDTGQTPIGWIDVERWARELGDAYTAVEPRFDTAPLRTLPAVQSWYNENNAAIFDSGSRER